MRIILFVSIRVHSGIGLEEKVEDTCDRDWTCFNPRSQRHRVGSEVTPRAETETFCFNPRSQRHRVGSRFGSGPDLRRSVRVSIRVHSGIGLEDAHRHRAAGGSGFNPRSQRHRVGSGNRIQMERSRRKVSIRVHSGIGLEEDVTGETICHNCVSIRVHSGIGLEADPERRAEFRKLFQSAFTAA